jgi:hypothetical protein
MPYLGITSPNHVFSALTALTAFSFHPQLADCDLRMVTYLTNLTALDTSTGP